LGGALFETLGVIRVFTKEPGMRVHSDHPFALRHGATVGELARNIHKEFVSNFLFAMVWAKRLPFSPKKVGLSFVLEDGDIVEIHTKI
jgi:ribosome-interacting GTPase 1